MCVCVCVCVYVCMYVCVTGSSVARRVGFAVQWLTCLTFDHSCYSPLSSIQNNKTSVFSVRPLLTEVICNFT